jgi:hypothetical protein
MNVLGFQMPDSYVYSKIEYVPSKKQICYDSIANLQMHSWLLQVPSLTKSFIDSQCTGSVH